MGHHGPVLHRATQRVQRGAEYLGVSGRTIRQMISDGRLTGYRNGTKLVRLDLNEIDASMEAFGGDVYVVIE